MQTPNVDKLREKSAIPAGSLELLELGLGARRKGDLAYAAQMLQAASTAAQNNFSILVELANTLRMMQRLDEADALYKHTLDHFPTHFGALVGLGHLSRQRGDRGAALAHFEAAWQIDPRSHDVLLETGHILREMRRFEDAEAVYRRVLEQAPDHVGAVLGLGWIRKEQTRWLDAVEHFEAAAALCPENVNIQLEIAHTLQMMRRMDAAEAAYKRVLDHIPRHVGALVGLGHVARQRADRTAALTCFESAARIEPSNLDIQAEIGNTLREMRRIEDAQAVYRRILKLTPDHLGAVLGLGYIAQERMLWQEALQHFETAAKSRPGNPNIQLEIAHTLRAMLHLSEAETVCRGVLNLAPAHAGAMVLLGSLARLRQDYAPALEWFQAASATDPSNLDVQVEIAHTLGEMNRSSEANISYQRVLEQNPRHVAALCGLGHLARQRLEWSTALTHFEAAAAANPHNLKPQFEIVSTLRELLRADEAEAILQHLEGCPGAKGDPELQVKKLEHFCATLQLERASECLASWGGHCNIPSAGVAFAAALYAARGQWHKVLELFRERVVEGQWSLRTGNYEMLLEAVSRAARATGEYAEVLALLDQLPEITKTHLAVTNLRDQLTEEIRLLHHVNPSTAQNGHRQNLEIGTPFRAWRANLLSDLLRHPSQAKPNRTIYLCTDRNYLPGAVIAIFSLLRHNMGVLRKYSIIVFCSDDIFDFASLIFDEIAARFAVRIDLRASTSLFLPDSSFRTDWGIFTPGHALSQAAYYRIYAALQLVNQGTEGRAVYLDADTCVGPHIDRLLEFDLCGHPIGVRLEISTMVGIRRAALKLGVDPGKYFNSGVLLFDLSHPKLAASLNHAIQISLTQKERLTFVDQCALNLAFQDNAANLPETFNLFVRQDTPGEAIPSDPVVRHFLERPKPWDPMYRTPNCVPWLDELAAVSQILAPGPLRRLLGLQFPVAEQI